MLDFLNRYLPKSITKAFKDPLSNFIQRQQKELLTRIEQLESVLEYKGISAPLAPAWLQIRVSGGYDGNFFRNGFTQIEGLKAGLDVVGLTLNDFDHILDFGVGCGRTLIPLSLIVEPRRLYGTDIDSEAIQWMQQHYSQFGGLNHNQPLPPLSYSDGYFGLIFSISIFTHLNETMQFAWLKELNRICKPGGILLVTFHGPYYIEQAPTVVQRKVTEHGFYFAQDSPLTEGLPEFYRTTYHSIDYINQHWGEYFEVLAIQPLGYSHKQDLAIMRKRL